MQTFLVGKEKAPDWFLQMLEDKKAVEVAKDHYLVPSGGKLRRATVGDIVMLFFNGSTSVSGLSSGGPNYSEQVVHSKVHAYNS